MAKLILWLIRCYQRSGGSKRWFGIECNFEPSCSYYTADAIKTYGLTAGVAMGWRRIKGCNQPDTICKCIDPVRPRSGNVNANNG
jgi:uncharacterized protein